MRLGGAGRARGFSAAILGAFSTAWFGWAQATPPSLWLTVALSIGTTIGLVTLVLGIVLIVRSPAASDPMRHRSVRRRYGIISGAQFGAILVAVLSLAVAGLQAWLPTLTCAIVGIHFFPLATVFRDRSLVVLGVVVTAVALLTLVVALASGLTPSALTCPLAGTCLLGQGIVALLNPRVYARSVPQTRHA